jgi:hypothetical protein
MECKVDANLKQCTCTYEPCRRAGELPGCLFPPEIERTYDRSIARFVQVYSRR